MLFINDKYMYPWYLNTDVPKKSLLQVSKQCESSFPAMRKDDNVGIFA